MPLPSLGGGVALCKGGIFTMGFFDNVGTFFDAAINPEEYPLTGWRFFCISLTSRRRVDRYGSREIS